MNQNTKIIHFVLALGLVILINLIASLVPKKIDLTDDKRFSLSEATKNILYGLDNDISIKVLLDGEIPAEMKRLQNSTLELLDEFRSRSRNITYFLDDPNAGAVEEVNATKESLRKDGIIPQRIAVQKGNERQESYIYPYVIIHFGERYLPISLLEQRTPGVPAEITLNNSISLLEYKLIDAIQKLTVQYKANIVFTTGHGELMPHQTAALERLLNPYFNTARLDLSTQTKIHEDIGMVVVAGPHYPFSDQDLFKMDQYIMHGGKVLWFIDPLKVSMDSLGRGIYIPPPNDVNLDDLFFKYGFRLEPNLLLDLECATIPLATGVQGGRADFEAFNYYYHPLILPRINHPIVKGLGRIFLQFPGTIDTIKTKTTIDKTVILESSQYARTQMTPVRMDFEMFRIPPNPEQFNKGYQKVGILLEGSFSSFFENRVKPQMEQGLDQIGQPFKAAGEPTKMAIISDSEFLKSYVGENNNISPIGFNPYDRKTYKANEDFILNLINYFFDENGVMATRSKEVKLRLLDKAKVKAEKSKWQSINIALPILTLILFGILFQFARKRKYTR